MKQTHQIPMRRLFMNLTHLNHKDRDITLGHQAPHLRTVKPIMLVVYAATEQ